MGWYLSNWFILPFVVDVYDLIVLAALMTMVPVVLFIYFFMAIWVVEQGTAVVIERFGKFHRRLDSGIHMIIPFIDTPRRLTWRTMETNLDHNGGEHLNLTEKKQIRIDLRDNVQDFPLQPVITRDNVELKVHPMVVYRIVDPVRACYEIYDLPQAVEKIVQTTLRSIIGDMGLDDTLASREEINRSLKQQISRIVANWGFMLLKVELLDLVVSRRIVDAMHEQLKAERSRRAAIIMADGYREQFKTEAEGTAQSSISLAKGEMGRQSIHSAGIAESKFIVADAEAKAVEILAEALRDHKIDPASYSVALKYIELLSQLSMSAKTRELYLPVESDIGGAVNSL